MTRIIRVFVAKTSYTPDDPDAYVGPPPLIWQTETGEKPHADVVHISATFSWDMFAAGMLWGAWNDQYPGRVRIGGPAFGHIGAEFVPGRYVKQGVTFTSRGCPRCCPWCLVPEREHGLKLIDPIPEGWIVNDNNFLSTSLEHRAKVYAMLARQSKAAVFAGGLDCRPITADTAEELRDVRIGEVFLACDTAAALGALDRAVQHLSFLSRDKLRCYVMVGFGNETIEEADRRIQQVYEIGCLPHVQVYRGPTEMRRRRSPEWSALVKASRPAAMKARMRGMR